MNTTNNDERRQAEYNQLLAKQDEDRRALHFRHQDEIRAELAAGVATPNTAKKDATRRVNRTPYREGLTQYRFTITSGNKLVGATGNLAMALFVAQRLHRATPIPIILNRETNFWESAETLTEKRDQPEPRPVFERGTFTQPLIAEAA